MDQSRPQGLYSLELLASEQAATSAHPSLQLQDAAIGGAPAGETGFAQPVSSSWRRSWSTSAYFQRFRRFPDPAHLIQMNDCYQASAELDRDPFIWIRCVGAGKHLKHTGQWALRTRIWHPCLKPCQSVYLNLSRGIKTYEGCLWSDSGDSLIVVMYSSSYWFIMTLKLLFDW